MTASPLRVYGGLPRSPRGRFPDAPADLGELWGKIPASVLADRRLGRNELAVFGAIMLGLYSQAKVSIITNAEIARLIGLPPDPVPLSRADRRHRKPSGERRVQLALAKLAKCGHLRVEADLRIAECRVIHLLTPLRAGRGGAQETAPRGRRPAAPPGAAEGATELFACQPGGGAQKSAPAGRRPEAPAGRRPEAPAGRRPEAPPLNSLESEAEKSENAAGAPGGPSGGPPDPAQGGEDETPEALAAKKSEFLGRFKLPPETRPRAPATVPPSASRPAPDPAPLRDRSGGEISPAPRAGAAPVPAAPPDPARSHPDPEIARLLARLSADEFARFCALDPADALEIGRHWLRCGHLPRTFAEIRAWLAPTGAAEIRDGPPPPAPRMEEPPPDTWQSSPAGASERPTSPPPEGLAVSVGADRQMIDCTPGHPDVNLDRSAGSVVSGRTPRPQPGFGPGSAAPEAPATPASLGDPAAGVKD